MVAVLLAYGPLRLALCKNFPKLRLGRPPPPSQPPVGWEVVRIVRPDGRALAGWLREVEGAHVAIASHGGGSSRLMASKSEMVPYGELLAAQNVSTLVLDGFGFGESDGLASPQGFAHATDIHAGIAWVKQRFPKKSVGLVGFSRGAVISIRAIAGMRPPPTFAILEGIGNERWEDVLIVGRNHSLPGIFRRWFVFVVAGAFQLFGYRRPEPRLAKAMQDSRCPILFVAAAGEQEEYIRVRMFYEQYAGVKSIYCPPAKTHGSVTSLHAAGLSEALRTFFGDHLAKTGPQAGIPTTTITNDATRPA